jgi:hypothetical protein
MKLTAEEKEFVEKTRLLSDTTFEQVRDFYEAFFSAIILNYLDEKPSEIPFLGKVNIKYLEDKITALGKEAQLEINVDAGQILKRTIGQIIDGEETEVEKIFQKKTFDCLNSKALQ